METLPTCTARMLAEAFASISSKTPLTEQSMSDVYKIRDMGFVKRTVTIVSTTRSGYLRTTIAIKEELPTTTVKVLELSPIDSVEIVDPVGPIDPGEEPLPSYLVVKSGALRLEFELTAEDEEE